VGVRVLPVVVGLIPGHKTGEGRPVDKGGINQPSDQMLNHDSNISILIPSMNVVGSKPFLRQDGRYM
jgi:hypothetical protein